MVQQGPKPDYAVNMVTMDRGIELFLDPVIADLETSGKGYREAHADVKAAHDAETPGWFAGQGNNRVRFTSSSFLNAAEWQLRQLTTDQDELIASLKEYRQALVGHLNWAKNTEDKITSRFQAIAREMDEGGR